MTFGLVTKFVGDKFKHWIKLNYWSIDIWYRPINVKYFFFQYQHLHYPSTTSSIASLSIYLSSLQLGIFPIPNSDGWIKYFRINFDISFCFFVLIAVCLHLHFGCHSKIYFLCKNCKDLIPRKKWWNPGNITFFSLPQWAVLIFFSKKTFLSPSFFSPVLNGRETSELITITSRVEKIW